MNGLIGGRPRGSSGKADRRDQGRAVSWDRGSGYLGGISSCCSTVFNYPIISGVTEPQNKANWRPTGSDPAPPNRLVYNLL
jgi:hypothetical protein